MVENKELKTLQAINKNTSLRKKLLPLICVLIIFGFLASTIGFSVCFLSEPYNYYYSISGVIGILLFLAGFTLCIFRAILGTKNDELYRRLNNEMIEKEKEDLRGIK